MVIWFWARYLARYSRDNRNEETFISLTRNHSSGFDIKAFKCKFDSFNWSYKKRSLSNSGNLTFGSPPKKYNITHQAFEISCRQTDITIICNTWKLVKCGCVSLSGGQKVGCYWRGPEKVCLSPQQTTPSSPSPFPVKFSTLWEAPTSASWWTCTVSRVQTLLSWVGLWWYVCVPVAIFVSICLKSHTAFILLLHNIQILYRTKLQ